jgi:hypothetical protein
MSHIVARLLSCSASRRRGAVLEQRRGLRLAAPAALRDRVVRALGPADHHRRLRVLQVAADLAGRQRRHVLAVVVGVLEVRRVRLDRALPMVQPEHEQAAGELGADARAAGAAEQVDDAARVDPGVSEAGDSHAIAGGVTELPYWAICSRLLPSTW